MSFSFHVRGATLALALAAVAVELDKVVAQQPVHAADREQIGKVVESHAALLTEDSSRDVMIYVSGSISTAEVSEGAPPFITGVNVSVGVHLTQREQAEG